MTIEIKPMHDHYAVIAEGKLVGTIERSIGESKTWDLHWIEGYQDLSYVPLNHAIREAMRWKPR